MSVGALWEKFKIFLKTNNNTYFATIFANYFSFKFPNQILSCPIVYVDLKIHFTGFWKYNKFYLNVLLKYLKIYFKKCYLFRVCYFFINNSRSHGFSRCYFHVSPCLKRCYWNYRREYLTEVIFVNCYKGSNSFNLTLYN